MDDEIAGTIARESTERAHLIAGACAFLAEEFPELAARIPSDARPFSLGYGVVDGVCTHPEACDRLWFSSHGSSRFLSAKEIPDAFFCAGIQNRGGSEYVLAMWRMGDRRFWFYEQYAVFVAENNQSPEKARQAFLSAIRDFESGARQ